MYPTQKYLFKFRFWEVLSLITCFLSYNITLKINFSGSQNGPNTEVPYQVVVCEVLPL